MREINFLERLAGGFWLAMSFRLNKSGIIGSLITMFMTTITVILILLIFILGSGVIKMLVNVETGVVIHDEAQTGLSDVFDYIIDYLKFVEVKYLIEGGMELDGVLVEVVNEE